ncbi:MAG: hypothetical protein ACK43M_20370 [Allorhizobium sp.]
MPDFSTWLSAHADRHRLRVREFLLDDDLVYEAEQSLKEIAEIIKKRAGGEWEKLPKDMMGLPLLNLVDQLMQAWEDIRAADSDHWRAILEKRVVSGRLVREMHPCPTCRTIAPFDMTFGVLPRIGFNQSNRNL